MSLAARLTLFFLIALGVILAGFSIGLFTLAHGYLYAQLDSRLETTLDVLSAAAEVEPDRVEWDPVEHRVEAIGTGRWVVYDDQGRIVSRSDNTEGVSWTTVREEDGPSTTKSRQSDVDGYRVKWRRAAGSGQVRTEPLDHDEHDALTLVVAEPLGPTQTSLRLLGLALVCLSGLIWLIAALAGRRLCRRGLAPLSHMAEAAANIGATDLDKRLPRPHTGDELEALCGAFNGLLERLEDSFERQRRFTGDASHQLRTPLTILLGQIEVARRRERTVAEYQSLLEELQRDAEHLKHIVESLLFLARPEAETLRPEMLPLDLRKWLMEYMGKWASHPCARDIQFEPAREESLGIDANPSLLAQVLDNLIENACKYSEPGNRIVVQAQRVGNEIALRVRDHGWGMDPDDLRQVFQPFFRSRQARGSGKPGVGLGLAVVQRLARLLDGAVQAESEKGRGSQFTLRLPARSGSANRG